MLVYSLCLAACTELPWKRGGMWWDITARQGRYIHYKVY